MAYCFEHNYPASVCPVCKDTELNDFEQRIRLLEKALELACRGYYVKNIHNMTPTEEEMAENAKRHAEHLLKQAAEVLKVIQEGNE